MQWAFHDLTIEGQSNDALLRERWQLAFASRPVSLAEPELVCVLNLVPEVPPPPPGAPQFRQGDLLAYYLDGNLVTAHFPRFGQLRLDVERSFTEGRLVRAALETYGVLEDLIAIGLSPHLRRRGLFLIHAFAAAYASSLAGATDEANKNFRAVLLVGDIGAGKTTTGLALLNAGWKLLSNDSPILRGSEALSYPGLLAAYPDTFARFPATAQFATHAIGNGRQKTTLAAEAIWPNIWLERAPVAAIVFPQIEPRAAHALEPLRPPEALRRLLPHAIEQWDKAMIPLHLALLSQLAQVAPAYRLRLSPDLSALPHLLATLTTDY